MSTTASLIEVTALAKDGGALTKRISLDAYGALSSDGSACIMHHGRARRAPFDGLASFAACIGSLAPSEAIALGALRDDLPDTVKVVTKARLELNGAAANDVIARTADFIDYRPERPALALFDIDVKGMPDQVHRRVDAAGGFWAALALLLPALEGVGRVVPASTSTGLVRADTGEKLAGSGGIHAFILVTDGADIERFLRVLHDRCWLHGLGGMVGAGGQLLERSIVDRMVGAPERLVFEGAPVLDPPLAQDQIARAPVATEGRALDTLAACPPLTIVEQAVLRDLRAKDAFRLAPDRATARDRFITTQTSLLTIRTGCTEDAARRTIERQCDGVLHPNVVLPFDGADLAGCTVGNVLMEPEKFVGATLADPLEGIGYGVCKAMIMRRADGTPWIHSFAHGRTAYELKRDAAAIETILLATDEAQLVATFRRLVVAGDLTGEEHQRIRDDVAKRSRINKRTIDQSINGALLEQANREGQEKAQQRAAERRDRRPGIRVPAADAPWIEQMKIANEVLSKARAAEPPTRDVEGERARLKMRSFPRMHLLSTDSSSPNKEA